MTVPKKETKLRKAVEKTQESEIMRSLVTLFFVQKGELLSRRGQSMASMGVKKLLDSGYDIEEFK